jgi:hypothetical protein
MYDNFMKIKQLVGELKWSHKNHGLGLTVSTKELVLQKPHINYHILLEDIVSIMVYKPIGKTDVRLEREQGIQQEITKLAIGGQQYRFYVRKATVHNRSGQFSLGSMDFILPVHSKLLQAIVDYSEMDQINA